MNGSLGGWMTTVNAWNCQAVSVCICLLLVTPPAPKTSLVRCWNQEFFPRSDFVPHEDLILKQLPLFGSKSLETKANLARGLGTFQKHGGGGVAQGPDKVTVTLTRALASAWA